MKPFRHAITAALLLGLAFAGSMPLRAADQGRLLGEVLDTKGAPIEGVKVTITSPGSSYHQEKVTDKKGRFTVVVVNAALPYELLFAKVGYATLKQPIRIPVGDLYKETFELPAAPVKGQPQQAAAEPTAEEKAQMKEQEVKGKAANVYNEGVQALNAGETTAAIAKIEEAAQVDPNLPEAPRLLAALYLDTKQYDKALAAADRALALKADDARTILVRYDILKAKGDPQAGAALEAAAKASPSPEIAKRFFNTGAELVRENKSDDAINYFKRASEVDPTLTPAYIAVANQYLRRKDYKAAVAAAETLLQREPQNLEALTIRYEALKAAGDKAGAAAAQAAMKGASGNQTPEATFKQGVTLFNAGSVADAKAAFERVIAADPNYAKAYYLLGLTYASDGKVKEAKENIQKFLTMAPNDPDATAAKEVLKSLD
ncbi:MAG TPA: tetratricopeptide repeat protein [Thermoanaerobaculia bacterium]|jgi:Tfp pilus assembly protein PilF|nr:tetratricopeptide repeat protein [Thermoanaerobaculia bacterium]